MGCGASSDTGKVIDPIKGPQIVPNMKTSDPIKSNLIKKLGQKNNSINSTKTDNFFRPKTSTPNSSSRKYKITKLPTLHLRSLNSRCRVNLLIEDGLDYMTTDELILS